MAQPMTPPVICRTGLFDHRNGQYRALLQGLSGAASVGDRRWVARTIVEDAAAVMLCAGYNEGVFDCCICRQVAVLRQCSAVTMLRSEVVAGA